MLGDIAGELVEVVGERDLSPHRSESSATGRRRCTATSRAAGRPERWITTSSPSSVSPTSRES